MKKIFSIIFLISVLAGCSEDTFDYRIHEPVVEDIDSVYFSTGSKFLIADGKATLDFVVEAFQMVQMLNKDSVLFDSLLPIDISRLPEGSVKVYKANGSEVGMSYSSTDAGSGTETFYAQIGSLKSDLKTVHMRPIPASFSKIYVDVIFHVFEQRKTASYYDPLSYQEIKYSQLQEAVANLNAVFNNKVGKGPNGASANIEFRLAEKNASGALLAQPGYFRIDYDQNTIKPNAYGNLPVTEFENYMNGAATRIWSHDKYLNIVIIPSGASESMRTLTPQYQLIPSWGTILDSIPGAGEVISDPSEATYNYANTCVGIPRTIFFPGVNSKIELYPWVGKFYGLYSTNQKSQTPGDYCTDTQLYDNMSNNNTVNSLLKTSLDGEKFMANNAMDDNRYPSLRNNLTLDQVTRIRRVIESCPGRMNAQNN